jgi:hypothetical protein
MANYCYHLRGTYCCTACAHNGDSPDYDRLQEFADAGESLDVDDLDGSEVCHECGMDLLAAIEEYLEQIGICPDSEGYDY